MATPRPLTAIVTLSAIISAIRAAPLYTAADTRFCPPSPAIVSPLAAVVHTIASEYEEKVCRSQTIDASASVGLLLGPPLAWPRLARADIGLKRVLAGPETDPWLPPFHIRPLPFWRRVALIGAIRRHAASRPRAPRPARLLSAAIAA